MRTSAAWQTERPTRDSAREFGLKGLMCTGKMEAPGSDRPLVYIAHFGSSQVAG